MSKTNDIPEDPIGQYLREMRGKNDNTLDNIRVAAEGLQAWADEHGIENVLQATNRDVRDHLLDLHEDGYAASTIRQKHMCLRTFFAVYTEGENEDESGFLPEPLSENPARFKTDMVLDGESTEPDKQQYVENGDGVTYLEPSEVDALIEAVPKPKIRNSLAVRMLVQTGARAGELCRLEVDDVKRDKGVVHIDDTKNGDVRRVPYQNLDPELSMWLDNGYRDRFSCAEESEYLFIGKQSGQKDEMRISERWLGEMIREAAYDAGIQEEWNETVNGHTKRKVTPHALRSTFCVQIFKQSNMSVPEVMELTGHDKIETVEEYAKVAREDAVDALADADVDFGT